MGQSEMVCIANILLKHNTQKHRFMLFLKLGGMVIMLVRCMTYKTSSITIRILLPKLIALNGSNNNQIALARIVKAYRFLMLTDQWGDMPYSEALQLKTQPKYDTQQEIYNGLFKELKKAVAQFDGGAVPAGDIVHNGNLTRWKKFANSLRLIMAVRLSKVDPTTGKANFWML
jgi:hypothetical protein